MARPTILTVDDDPLVSEAIARDLTSQYGADYRIVRATSGPEALGVLTRLALRDEPVALIAADQRIVVHRQDRRSGHGSALLGRQPAGVGDAPVDPAAQVVVLGVPADHPLLGQSRPVAEDVPDPGGEAFVVRHRTRLPDARQWTGTADWTCGAFGRMLPRSQRREPMRYKVGAEQLQQVPSLAHRADGVFRVARTAPVGPTHAVCAVTGATVCGIEAAPLEVLNEDWEAACFVEKCPGCFAAVVARGQG